MPTLLLLDVSLSMSRPIKGSGGGSGGTDGEGSGGDMIQIRQLAVHAINTLLDYLTQHAKLEFVSLVIFSAAWEHLVPWTRDYSTIRAKLTELGDYSKTCFETALTGVGALVMEEWGCNTPCQVVLFTDGNVSVGQGSLPATLAKFTSLGKKSPLPYPFPSRIHVISLLEPDDKTKQQYNKLVEMNYGHGQLLSPAAPVNMAGVAELMNGVGTEHFTPYSGLLKCGNLSCPVQIMPAPIPYCKLNHRLDFRSDDFDTVEKSVEKTIEICGFLNIKDLGSPPYISRHLVLPVENPSSSSSAAAAAASGSAGGEEAGAAAADEEGKPAFTVLLHGSLKVGGTVAVVQLAKDWYGMIYSWADKKKSNLMLSIFKPGSGSLPWLGELNNLAPLTDFDKPPYGEDDNASPFPVRPSKRRSYTQNCVVWIKDTGLQADIQKIIRNARKIPEKQLNFYKELNRLRCAAISLGFYDILSAVAQLLDRECQLLPANSHAAAALQLTHAASKLRSPPHTTDISQPIVPLATRFAGGE